MSEDTLEIIESFYPTAYTLGDVGEVLTASALRSECKLSIIRNLYLPSRGHLAEIDMIGISPLGVFVIENKNYRGLITGSFEDYYWNVKYDETNFERLYNPVKQNEVHRRVVKDLLESLGYFDIPVYNSVIFNDKGILNLKNVKKNVFSLTSFIQIYNTVSKDLISLETQKELYTILQYFSDMSDDAKILHINLLKGLREVSNE